MAWISERQTLPEVRTRGYALGVSKGTVRSLGVTSGRYRRKPKRPPMMEILHSRYNPHFTCSDSCSNQHPMLSPGARGRG